MKTNIYHLHDIYVIYSGLIFLLIKLKQNSLKLKIYEVIGTGMYLN